MNIDTYKRHVHAGLEKLSQLISNVNDIVENRIEKNLKMVTRTLLVNLPKQESLALDEFVLKQELHVRAEKGFYPGKKIARSSTPSRIL